MRPRKLTKLEDHDEDLSRKYGNNRHIQVKSACGMPHELWEKMSETTKKECPDCFLLKGKQRACLKCEEKFQPGCKLRHLCSLCSVQNKMAYD